MKSKSGGSQAKSKNAPHPTHQMAAAIRMLIPLQPNKQGAFGPIAMWLPRGSHATGKGWSLRGFLGCQQIHCRL